MMKLLTLALLAWPTLAAAQTVRLTDPLVVSPAELHRLTRAEFGVRYTNVSATDEQVYEAGGGGKITDVISDEGALITFGAPHDASLFYAVSVDRRTRHLEHDLEASPGIRTEAERSRLNVTGSAAFKIMDKLVLGAALGSNTLSSDDGDESGFLNADLALAVKSETYDLGVVQHVARVVARDDEIFWSHAQDLHLRVLAPNASAWTLLIRRGPQTTCCVPATTRHLTYALGYSRLFAAVEGSVIYRYAPAYKEDARFGKVYDVTRHGFEAGGHYAVTPSSQIGLTGTYETGHEENAAVEIPTALETVETADYKASKTGLALTLTLLL